MTDFNGFADNCLGNETAWAAEYDQDLINNVIPYVQAHYNVSTEASRRAFAGLSCGGGLANSLLANYTSEFGYFGVFSPYPGLPTTTLSNTQVAAINQVGVFIGGGWQDPIHFIATGELNTLLNAGIAVTPDFLNAGHEWYVWRILLYDFLIRVAFWPPVTG
jgi:enterochelin esterase-like enzyme